MQKKIIYITKDNREYKTIEEAINHEAYIDFKDILIEKYSTNEATIPELIEFIAHFIWNNYEVILKSNLL